MFSLDVSYGGVFDNDGYDEGVGVGDEDWGVVWVGVICVCEEFVGNVPNLSKVMICGAVVESVTSVAIYDSIILGYISGGWYVTWVVKEFCLTGVDNCRIEYDVFGACLLLSGDG